jgi:type IV secretion system protein VirB1
MDVMNCQPLAVPYDVMHHVASIESSLNPYAIGVVGARLIRQPRSLGEAVATARMLETRGYNFSVGLAQVNRYNLPRYGLHSYHDAFDGCTNLRIGASILSHCLDRSGHDWGRAFSCYYSGNFVTGFRTGYVQKVLATWRRTSIGGGRDAAIAVTRAPSRHMSRIEASVPASGGDVAAAPAPTAAADRTRLAMIDSAVVLARQPAMPVVVDNAPPATSAPVPDAAFVF